MSTNSLSKTRAGRSFVVSVPPLQKRMQVFKAGTASAGVVFGTEKFHKVTEEGSGVKGE